MLQVPNSNTNVFSYIEICIIILSQDLATDKAILLTCTDILQNVWLLLYLSQRVVFIKTGGYAHEYILSVSMVLVDFYILPWQKNGFTKRLSVQVYYFLR